MPGPASSSASKAPPANGRGQAHGSSSKASTSSSPSAASIVSPGSSTGIPAAAAAALGWGGTDAKPHPSPYPFFSQGTGMDAGGMRPLGLLGGSSGATTSSAPAKGAKAKDDKAKAATSNGKGGSGAKAAKAGAAAAAKAKQEEAESAEERKPKKRRRVVVACDTCRRKKIRCVGLPNATNTCDNCAGMGYTCTFTVDGDRSRGKYEIMEAKVETLLSALRSVAPALASQYERGELSMTVAAGTTGGTARRGSTGGSDGGDGSGDDADGYGAQGDAGGSRPGEHGVKGEGDVKAQARGGISKHMHMLPDIEEGRPRYFGASSNLNDFHGLESRAPSPGPGAGHGGSASRSHVGSSAAGAAGGQGHGPIAHGLHHSTTDEQPNEGGGDRRVLPKPQVLYPENSRDWVHNLRKRNLCGIGRDDEGFLSDNFVNRHQLPQPDLLEHLLDIYFRHLNPLMPILNRQLIARDLSLGRPIDDVAFRGLIFAVLAIASRFSSDPRVLADPNDPTSAGLHFASASRLYHQVHSASLINVQVMLLTATFSSGSLGSGFSWTTLGAAIRALFDIGLHQEKAYASFCQAEQELRRRTFWGAFTLEVLMSVNMGRPLGLRLADCDVRMPLCVSDAAIARAGEGRIIADNEDTSLMQGFIHLIKLSHITSEVIQLIYAPGKRQPEYKDMALLIRKLDEWSASKPSSGPKLLNGLLESSRYDVRLYVLRPFLHLSQHLRQLLYPQCVDAARNCLRVVIELHAGGELSDFFFMFLQAFLSTVTFMITFWHQASVEHLNKDQELIESSLRLLGSLDHKFIPALLRRAHRLLCRIAERMSQRQMVGSAQPTPGPPPGRRGVGRSPSVSRIKGEVELGLPSPKPGLPTSPFASGPGAHIPRTQTPQSADRTGAPLDGGMGGPGSTGMIPPPRGPLNAGSPGAGPGANVPSAWSRWSFSAFGPSAIPTSASSPSAAFDAALLSGLPPAPGTPGGLAASGLSAPSPSDGTLAMQWMGAFGAGSTGPGASGASMSGGGGAGPSVSVGPDGSIALNDRAWEGFFERFLNDVEPIDSPHSSDLFAHLPPPPPLAASPGASQGSMMGLHHHHQHHQSVAGGGHANGNVNVGGR